MINPGCMASVHERIGLLTDLFLGAAYADHVFGGEERAYLCDLLCDLLSTRKLPEALERQIEHYDPRCFDLQAAAQDFRRDPPMKARRLLELVAYVMLADGEQNVNESAFLGALGEALGLAPADYADLTREGLRLRHSFVDLARVPLPGTWTRP